MGQTVLGVLALILVVSTVHAPVRAEPSIWANARDPMARRTDRVLARIERTWDMVSQAERDPSLVQDLRRDTLAIAETSGARAIDDPRVTYLLARVLSETDPTREEEVSALLARARRNTGADQAWLRAEIDATWAESTQNDPRLAIARATRALAQQADPARCASLHRKRSDAKLALGDLRGAAEDARRAVARATSASDRSSAHALLAVVLDRSGDTERALYEMRLARWTAPEPELVGLWEVFVFRPHDLHYARALSFQAESRNADDEEETHAALALALDAWDHYLTDAPSDDAFRTLAQAHRAACARALERMQGDALDEALKQPL
ncbi:MAG TPA: hypothetical protein VFQ61_34450 [Polyangiaceae bacterium]|nr:hypothetical protein [Polyangiaceae bacterium]